MGSREVVTLVHIQILREDVSRNALGLDGRLAGYALKHKYHFSKHLALLKT